MILVREKGVSGKGKPFDNVKIRSGVFGTLMVKIDDAWTPFRGKDLKNPENLEQISRGSEAFITYELGQGEFGSIKAGVSAGVYQIGGTADHASLDDAFGNAEPAAQ